MKTWIKENFEDICFAIIILIGSVLLMFLLSTCPAQAQVVKQGHTFSYANSGRATQQKDTLLTSYTFKDSKGTEYPIIINKANGRCWVWRKSSKTGRMYKSYLKPDMAKEVCKELDIPYIEK